MDYFDLCTTKTEAEIKKIIDIELNNSLGEFKKRNIIMDSGFRSYFTVKTFLLDEDYREEFIIFHLNGGVNGELTEIDDKPLITIDWLANAIIENIKHCIKITDRSAG